MHVAAEKDFQRPAIFSPDAHEMRLIGALAIGIPLRRHYWKFFDAHGVNPRTSAMFEDRGGNHLVPHELGMKTVLVVDPLIGDSDIL